MGPRRSHTKSRRGCHQCKSRRIKCDEISPQCSNCIRRQIGCDYPITSAPPHATSRHDSNANASASANANANSSINNSYHDTPNSSTPVLLSPVPNESPAAAIAWATSASIDIIDLELLHHYTTYTYKTLPSGAAPDQHELWQIQVVQLGFEHEFLLRGILAVSALHLSHLRPNRKETLALRASLHQSIAMERFNQALNRVDQSNCVALFAFSCIIVALTFATSKRPEHPGIRTEIFEWFYMVRGCNSVVQTQWETVSQSFLGPLIKRGMVHETAAAHNVQDTEHVTALLRLCSGEGVASDSAAANAYALAIHELLNVYTQVSILTRRNEDFIPVILIWPVAIPQLYMTLLSEHRPEAMVILAYYAALLHRADGQWYMCGWPRCLIKLIGSALGDEWDQWLEWPKYVTWRRDEYPPTM